MTGPVIVDGTVYVPGSTPAADWVPLLAAEDVYATDEE
jgi:hypothetical protein